MYIYTHVYIFYMFVYLVIYLFIYVFIYLSIYLSICSFIYLFIHTYIYICLHIYIFIYSFILYIYICIISVYYIHKIYPKWPSFNMDDSLPVSSNMTEKSRWHGAPCDCCHRQPRPTYDAWGYTQIPNGHQCGKSSSKSPMYRWLAYFKTTSICSISVLNSRKK